MGANPTPHIFQSVPNTIDRWERSEHMGLEHQENIPPPHFIVFTKRQRGLISLRLSLNRMRKMDGERVYVFSENMWARINTKGPYPLLLLENGECRSWEDWQDVQSGGIYTRRPVLKSLLAKCAKAIR